MKRFVLCVFLIAVFFSGCAGESPQYTPQAPQPETRITDDTVYRVPILMYHRVYAEKPGAYCITPEEFESDLVFLAENGFSTITVSELIDFKDGIFKMPEKPVVLTFDDGNYNNYTEVFPLLKKYNAKATFFVIGIFTERFSSGRQQYPATSHMSFDNLREMSESGLCDIQNHTYDLHDWTRGRFGVGKKKGETEELFEDYQYALERDILKTQSILRDGSGIAPRAFAYPFGVYNADAEVIIKNMGFKAILTTDEGINIVSQSGADNLFRLKRYNRPHSKPLTDIVSFDKM